MNILNPVSTIMTPHPICVGAHESIAAVAKLFEGHKIHHLPVIEEGSLVGLISKSDYLLFRRGFNNENNQKMEEEVRLNNFQARDIMTKGLAKLEPSDKINVALEIFKENLFHGIPIVEDDQVVGIVTTYDIIKHIADDTKSYAEYE